MKAHPYGERAGFTLIEMLISVSIIALISATVIFQHQRFNSGLLLKNAGYELALTIREAQTLGIGVRGLEEDFGAAYGAHFATGTTYLLFRDDNDDSRYSAGDTVISTSTIGRRNSITRLCVGRVPLAGGECTHTSLDVMFRRPSPDAFFYPVVANVDTASIRVSPTPVTSSSTITITTTGQITVQ